MYFFRKFGSKSLESIMRSNDRIHLKDITNTDPNEISRLSFQSLRKLSYILYTNYEKSSEYEEFDKKLQRHLTKIFPKLHVHYKSLIIKNLSFGLENDVEFNKDLLLAMLNSLKTLKGFSFENNELIGLLKFLQIFDKNKIEYEAYIREYFSEVTVERLENINNKEIGVLCLILYRIGMINKYFDIQVEGKEGIYSVIERVVMRKISSLGVKDAYNVLRCFVTNDRGSEDFCRILESKVFSNLSHLFDKELADIPNFYIKRKLYNFDYLLNSIYKPLYHEIVKRFDFIDPFTLSLSLFNYWRNSTINGLYCTNELPEKLKALLSKKDYFTNIDPKTRSFLIQNIISLLSYTRKLDEQSIHALLELEKIFSDSLGEVFYMRIINYLSREGKVDDLILEKFLQCLNKLCEDRENFKSLYHIWLNIKLRIPEKFEKIENFFSQTRLDECLIEWKKSKSMYLAQSESSQIHREFEKILKNMNIEYEFEYFDVYFIDLALPKLRICIEIHGPGHYIFPDLVFNGKTQNKMEILEKLGWKYNSYAFFTHKNRTNSITSYLAKVIPLEFN